MDFECIYLDISGWWLLQDNKKWRNQAVQCSKIFYICHKSEDIYAGATEETSVLEVEDTSEPSSTCFPKSCIMHERNYRRGRRTYWLMFCMSYNVDRTKIKVTEKCKILQNCYLSVHEDIDNGVVNGGALCKICRHSCCQWVKGITRVSNSKADKVCVWSPAETISSNHDKDHSGDFLFSLLCWFRFLLLCCNLV